MKIRWSANLIVRYIAFVLGFFLLSGIHLDAQTSNGTILGNVEDSSGAAVANAEVTVTNQDTGVARSTVSTAEGIYDVPSLPPGKYTVEAKAVGFSPVQIKDVVVAVGSSTKVDLKVQVGQVTQTVTVTEAVPAGGDHEFRSISSGGRESDQRNSFERARHAAISRDSARSSMDADELRRKTTHGVW